jgi:hypothetical protein
MEEVDSIIIQSLREVGCDFDEDVKLKTLSPEDVYKSILTLCKIIKPEAEVPKALPVQMAQRFAASSQLVDCCKSLGFKGDLGYQTILYSNINELRRVFMWLIEQLPKSEDKTDSYQGSATVSKAKIIENEIAKKLAKDLKKLWVLDFLQKPSNIRLCPDELEINYNIPIFHQTRNLIPSLILTHDQLIRTVPVDSSDIAKKLRSSTVKSTQSLLMPSPSRSTISSIVEKEPSEVPKIKTPLEILSEKVENLKESIDMQEDIFRQLTSDKVELLKSIENEAHSIEKSKKDNKLKMQIAMLLDNPEESIEKLKQSLDAAAQKRANLNAKFLAHKEPLEQQLDSFSGINSIKLQKIKERQENVRNVKRAIAEIHEDMKHKVQLQQSLQAELSKMKRTTERSAYTSRIADIIKSIKRQNYDINEILKDTRMLQKSINNVEGQLQRQFTVTEELVWTKVKIRLKYLNFIIF